MFGIAQNMMKRVEEEGEREGEVERANSLMLISDYQPAQAESLIKHAWRKVENVLFHSFHSSFLLFSLLFIVFILILCCSFN